MTKACWTAIGFVVLATACWAAPAKGTVESESEPSYQTLKAENEALRRENQMLRRELVAKKGVLPDTLLPQKVVEPNAKPEAQGEDTGYWLSSKSKIRHNARCRNYRQVKGRPCGTKDGKACKACGG